MALLTALRLLLGLCLLAYAAYALISVWAARQWHRSRRPLDPAWTPPVTILKPVRGVDAEAYENFASFCRQDYPPERVQILFGALDPDDPALALVPRLQAAFPGQAIEIVRAGQEALLGPNLKVCNLAAMLPFARHDLLVLCDSDMRVEPDYLRRIVAPFAPSSSQGGPPVGLVTCPYRGDRAQSFAAVLEALGIGADFIPSALVSRATEGVGFAFGSTIALPRAVLAELGGFPALADELADDFRLGSGAKRAGYEVVLSDYVVNDVLGAERFGAMWARRLRWARTVRACRPVGYAGSLTTHGTALALLFLASSGSHPFGWMTVALVLALRLTTALWIACRCTQDTNVLRWWPFLPVSDLIGFALYVISYCGNHIQWRGERFRLLPGGKLLRAARR
jgi:ceramide glucosyltransferase